MKALIAGTTTHQAVLGYEATYPSAAGSNYPPSPLHPSFSQYPSLPPHETEGYVCLCTPNTQEFRQSSMMTSLLPLEVNRGGRGGGGTLVRSAAKFAALRKTPREKWTGGQVSGLRLTLRVREIRKAKKK